MTHDYKFTLAEVEALYQACLRSLAFEAMAEEHNMRLDKRHEERLKTLSTTFKTTLEKEQ